MLHLLATEMLPTILTSDMSTSVNHQKHTETSNRQQNPSAMSHDIENRLARGHIATLDIIVCTHV